VLKRGGEPPRGEPNEQTVEALSRIGITTRMERLLPGDTLADTLGVDSLRDPRREAMMDSLAREEIVFALRTFRATSTVPATDHRPAGPNYRVGPGDELLLILTGDVEAAYSLDVTREGCIFIPDVG
jgi:hypothetical protein